MEKLPSYSTQFNKITEAYIENKLHPYDQTFCFCGTIENNDPEWWSWAHGVCINYDSYYTGNQLKEMEKALLIELYPLVENQSEYDYLVVSDKERDKIKNHDEYENLLFNGMVAALEVLKQIHIEHGEVIDEEPVFIKRIASLNQSKCN